MIFSPNVQYTNASKALQAVRDCIEGEPTIKRHTTKYLKHPGLNGESTESDARYSKYIEGAEFDGYPSSTESAMLGKMKASDADIEMPSGIEYLENNSDGDGTPMTALVEILYKNLLEAKYHILLAEMDSLASLDAESISVADLKSIDPKATIKSYTRESLIDWDYRTINGAQQLSLLILREDETVRDSGYAITTITTYLVLGLDDEGYFQQKYINGGSGDYQADGEKLYPQVGGKNLQWIPVQIVADESFEAGSIPKGLGYLYPICSRALSGYQVSADYKEALRFMQATLFTKGWKQGDYDQFKELNGREQIEFGVGVANNMPNSVEVEVVGLGVQSEPYERYADKNEAKARALGATFDTTPKASNVSATEAGIAESNQTAAMSSIVNNIEDALLRMSSYCGMFMGLWSADDVEANIDNIKIDLYNDFGKVKMSPEEVTATINTVNSGLISKDEGLKILVQGGFTVSDAETIEGQIEEQGPQEIQPASTQETEEQ